MRVIGLDVHRRFAQIAELKEGVLRQRGRLDLVRHKILEFARTLDPDDEVVLGATGNTMAIVRLLKPHVGKVIIANPLQVRIIADAKVKTDRIDAAVLARLHAAGYLPEVWQPDEATERLRRLVARRAGIVQGMTRTKNRIHSVLHANLIPPYQGKLFMAPGRKWLAEQPLAEDERLAVDHWLAALDAMEEELTEAERALAAECLGDDRIRRLMTIGGINMPVAAGVVSAIGDVSRFSSAERLVSYLGLDPRVRQSGDKTRPAWADQQAGPGPCAWNAGAGCMGRHNNARTATCILCAHPEPQGQTGRSRRDGTQDRGAGMASADQAGGLRVGSPCTGGHEAAANAAEGGRQLTTRRQCARSRSGLQHQSTS